MNSAKRREDKKRRRDKRVAKKQHDFAPLKAALATLEQLAKIPAPATYPGACDPSLARPDAVKFEYAQFVANGPSAQRSRQFERNIKQGLLGFYPEVDHWAMEEYFWHGAPDQTSHPLDDFIARNRSRFSAAAQTQLALWKQARIGFFEIGACANDLVAVRELDPLTLRPIGDWMQAIALCIGGVHQYAQAKGLVVVTYLAPWAPDQNIYCMMGYGNAASSFHVSVSVPVVLGFRNAKAISKPLPWNAGPAALQRCVEQWSKRDWCAWMAERVRCPFEAFVMVPDNPCVLTIQSMVTSSEEEFRRMGLYFAAGMPDNEVGVIGATNICPIDFDSSEAQAFAEYHKFRQWADQPRRERGRR